MIKIASFVLLFFAMFWNVASARYKISLRKCLAVLRTLRGALNSQECALFQ